MADAIPGWHSAKVPNHLSLPLLRKPQTPLLEPHPYDCIQASFPPQGPASRYHRHTLFGDCVFNIRILGSTLGTHDFLDSSLRPLPQSWNSLFLLSTSSNLWNLTFSKDLLLSDQLLCVSSAHAIHVNYMLKKTQESRTETIKPPIHYIIIYCLLAKVMFWPTVKKREGDTGLWFMPFSTGFSFIINTLLIHWK